MTDYNKFGLAMVFAATASLSTAIGLILIKIGIIKSERKQSKCGYLFRIWWLTGLLFMLGGQLLNGMVLTYGNVILMSQTSSFTIIYTAILSPIILGEDYFWTRDGVTILIISLGSYLAIS